MEVNELIEEMKATKLANPTLETTDVLKIFQIAAMTEQTRVIRSKK